MALWPGGIGLPKALGSIPGTLNIKTIRKPRIAAVVLHSSLPLGYGNSSLGRRNTETLDCIYPELPLLGTGHTPPEGWEGTA